MTKEEMDFIGSMNMCDEISNEAYKKIMTHCEEQEPCDDCISRQAVLDALYALCDTGETLKENPWRDNPHIDAITDAIEDLPSVTPQPKTGRWEWVQYDGNLNIGNWHCSECRTIVPYMPENAKHTPIRKWCPNCGAKMEVSE